MPPHTDLELATLSVALSAWAGDGAAAIWLAPDLDGRAHPEKVIEHFLVNAPLRPAIVSTQSVTNPVLKRGARYWLLLSTQSMGSEVDLWSAPTEFMPRSALIAQRRDGGEWEVAESKGGPGYAIRIVGRPLPPVGRLA